MKTPLRWEDIERPLDFTGYACDVPWTDLRRWIDNHRPHNPVEMDPDFQRGHVWSAEQRTAFVEFCLRGGTSGNTVYWNCPGYMSPEDRELPLQLVDGLQRVSAVLGFMQGRVRVLGGYSIGEIEGAMRWSRYRFRMCVNQLPTRSQVLKWYLALNDGGVVHTSDELDRVRMLLEAERINGSFSKG